MNNFSQGMGGAPGSNQDPTRLNLPQVHFTPVGGGGPTAPPPAQLDEVARLLRDLVALTRDLSGIARQQLELSRRWEQRAMEQQQTQRDEFLKWLTENPDLRGRSKQAEDTVRGVVGKALGELLDYVENHNEDLTESDFVRSEMVDRYGPMLMHLYGIHGVLKRLSTIEQQQQQQAQSKPPGP